MANKSAQIDPIEEAMAKAEVQAPAKKAEKAEEAPKVIVPPAPAAVVPPPPKFRLDMPERRMVGVGGKMTWVQPGQIVSEHTHSKNFLEGLKSSGIKMVEVVEEKAKEIVSKVEAKK